MLVLAEQNAEGESPDGCSAREPDPAGPAPCRVVLLSLAADQAGEEQDCGHSTCAPNASPACKSIGRRSSLKRNSPSCNSARPMTPETEPTATLRRGS